MFAGLHAQCHIQRLGFFLAERRIADLIHPGRRMRSVGKEFVIRRCALGVCAVHRESKTWRKTPDRPHRPAVAAERFCLRGIKTRTGAAKRHWTAAFTADFAAFMTPAERQLQGSQRQFLEKKCRAGIGAR